MVTFLARGIERGHGISDRGHGRSWHREPAGSPGATTTRIELRDAEPNQSRIERNSGLSRPSPDSMTASPHRPHW